MNKERFNIFKHITNILLVKLIAKEKKQLKKKPKAQQ